MARYMHAPEAIQAGLHGKALRVALSAQRQPAGQLLTAVSRIRLPQDGTRVMHCRACLQVLASCRQLELARQQRKQRSRGQLLI